MPTMVKDHNIKENHCLFSRQSHLYCSHIIQIKCSLKDRAMSIQNDVRREVGEEPKQLNAKNHLNKVRSCIVV